MITAAQVGYLGSALIVGVLSSAFVLSRLSNRLSKTHLFSLALLCLLLASLLLFVVRNPLLLGGIYLSIGVATGLGLTTVSEIAAEATVKGKRFGAFANIAMLLDIFRIVYPMIVAAAYLFWGLNGLIIFALITILMTVLLIGVLRTQALLIDVTPQTKQTQLSTWMLRKNPQFALTLLIEFLDSFASSQLFVFLPTLLIFRGFAIESALGLQSVVFAGYFCGRWFVSFLARKLNGYTAVAWAEIGMIVSIVALLMLPSSIILYAVCFLLGVFTRGTSPVVKALVFDQLAPEQNRQGAALHIFFGDTGSAIGQLIFGLLLAWVSVSAPFMGAALAAGIVAIACFGYQKKYQIHSEKVPG